MVERYKGLKRQSSSMTCREMRKTPKKEEAITDDRAEKISLIQSFRDGKQPRRVLSHRRNISRRPTSSVAIIRGKSQKPTAHNVSQNFPLSAKYKSCTGARRSRRNE